MLRHRWFVLIRLMTAIVCYLRTQLPRQYAFTLEVAERMKLNGNEETTLSYASVMGIKKDIHLVKDDYQWLGSMFYFGPSIPFKVLYHLLIKTRVPGMGVSNKPIAPVIALSQILFLLHHHVGSRTLLYGGLQELCGSCSCPVFPRCL